MATREVLTADQRVQAAMEGMAECDRQLAEIRRGDLSASEVTNRHIKTLWRGMQDSLGEAYAAGKSEGIRVTTYQILGRLVS